MKVLDAIERQAQTIYERHGKLFIMDEHNKALAIWYAALKDSAFDKVNLVTFDSHTDTDSVLHNPVDIEHKTGVRTLSGKVLSCQEDEALASELIRLSLNIHNSYQICTFNELHGLSEVAIVMPREAVDGEAEEDAQLGLASRRLNWVFGEAEIGPDLVALASDMQPYILDIDLDYFVQKPDFSQEWWGLLMRNALAITVAREPVFYADLCGDNGLTLQALEKQLVSQVAAASAS